MSEAALFSYALVKIFSSMHNTRTDVCRGSQTVAMFPAFSAEKANIFIATKDISGKSGISKGTKEMIIDEDHSYPWTTPSRQHL